MPTPTGKTTRAERLAQPLARVVAEQIAADHGVCIRPVALRRIDTVTGVTEVVDVPCGSTLESRCPACARRKRSLRRTQCEEGWHLAEEPVITPNEPTTVQRAWVEQRAVVTAERDRLAARGADPEALAELDAAIADLDEEIAASGLRGRVAPSSASAVAKARPRRVRSTRRRQDAPELPKRPMVRRTVGRAFTDPDIGRVFRPSLFLTLTCDSYGRVRSDGTPVDPASYDYRRAARDALHFSKLVDRFVQNLRRVAGFEVQYFATVEPQRRLAPHLHMAIRGTIPRAELRQIAAATYHQVWWPPTDRVVFVIRMHNAPTDRPAPAVPLPPARLHDLRHLHATTLLMAGVPVHVVAARLGHADPAITLRVYAHVVRDAETAAAEVFAQALADGDG